MKARYMFKWLTFHGAAAQKTSHKKIFTNCLKKTSLFYNQNNFWLSKTTMAIKLGMIFLGIY